MNADAPDPGDGTANPDAGTAAKAAADAASLAAGEAWALLFHRHRQTLLVRGHARRTLATVATYPACFTAKMTGG